MVGQPRLFDPQDRSAELSKSHDPLERLSSVVGFEVFRPTLDAALGRKGRSKGDQPPLDAVMMFKILVLQAGLAAELATLPGALVVPLGRKVSEAVEALARQSVLDPAYVLASLLHSSGVNAERVAFFLGRKPWAALSAKVDADKIFQACTTFIAKVAALG